MHYGTDAMYGVHIVMNTSTWLSDYENGQGHKVFEMWV